MAKKRTTYYVVVGSEEWGGNPNHCAIRTISPDKNSNHEKQLLNLWDKTYLPGILEALEKQGLVKWDAAKHAR